MSNLENSYRRRGFLISYADGCCINHAQAGFGVFFPNNQNLNISEPLDERIETNSSNNITNQTAEVEAVLRAINTAVDNGFQAIVIFTDSQYAISSLTDWCHTWINNGWMRNDNGRRVRVTHEPQFRYILDMIQQTGITVEYEFVRGHSGNYGNDCADDLAKRGARMMQPVYRRGSGMGVY